VRFFLAHPVYAVACKNCLKEQLENQGQQVDFLNRRHISTSGFASTATRRPFLPHFCPYSPEIGRLLDGTNGLSSFKPCAYCWIVHRADVFAIAQLSCCKYGLAGWLSVEGLMRVVGR